MLWSLPHEVLLNQCATRVARGEADGILDNRDSLTHWLIDRDHPERCEQWTPSPRFVTSACCDARWA